MIMNPNTEKYEVQSQQYDRSNFVRRTSYFLAASLSVAAAVWVSAQPAPRQGSEHAPGTIRGFSAA